MFNNFPSSLPPPIDLPQVITSSEETGAPSSVAEAWKSIEAWMNAERKALQELRNRFEALKQSTLHKQAAPITQAAASALQSLMPKKRKETPAVDAPSKLKVQAIKECEPHHILLENSRTMLKEMINGKKVHFQLDHKRGEAYDSLSHEFYESARKHKWFILTSSLTRLSKIIMPKSRRMFSWLLLMRVSCKQIKGMLRPMFSWLHRSISKRLMYRT